MTFDVSARKNDIQSANFAANRFVIDFIFFISRQKANLVGELSIIGRYLHFHLVCLCFVYFIDVIFLLG